MDPLLVNNQTEPWTNEKHLHFLNSMEATFVRTVLENNGRHLRLDRYLPDSSESTLDLKSQTQRRKKHTTSDMVGPTPRTRGDGRSDKRTRRRLSSQSHDLSEDQVVPQIDNRAGDKDESDPTNVAVASAH